MPSSHPDLSNCDDIFQQFYRNIFFRRRGCAAALHLQENFSQGCVWLLRLNVKFAYTTDIVKSKIKNLKIFLFCRKLFSDWSASQICQVVMDKEHEMLLINALQQ